MKSGFLLGILLHKIAEGKTPPQTLPPVKVIFWMVYNLTYEVLLFPLSHPHYRQTSFTIGRSLNTDVT